MPASRVACASFNLGTNTTISITRDNSSYTHTLTYNFNGVTGTIATRTTATTYVWSPPADVVARFYATIPNATTGYGTVNCTTYDANGGVVGTTTAGFYAYVVKENSLPTVTGTVVDTNASTIAVTGSNTRLVQYMSKPRCTISATAKNGASIHSYQIENPVGLVTTTSPYVFDTVYSKEFRFKATDSRGYSTTTLVNVGTFIPYEPCYFLRTPTVARTESTSTTATTTLQGYCFNGSFGSATNTLTVKYRYKAGNGAYGNYTAVTRTWNTDGTFTASVSIPNLLLSNTYTIEFVVEDRLTSFSATATVGQSIGDLRIAQDHILVKNPLIIGTNDNVDFKPLRVRRRVNNAPVRSEFGVSDEAMAGAVIQLFKNNNGVARIDLREDAHLYNFFSNMSFAEIMSFAPSMANDGSQGYAVFNGGDTSPILMQWGKLSMTPASPEIATSQPVTFPHSFVGIPAVFTTALSTQGGMVESAPHNITQNGFTAFLRRVNVDSTIIHWFAIGNGANALPE